MKVEAKKSCSSELSESNDADQTILLDNDHNDPVIRENLIRITTPTQSATNPHVQSVVDEEAKKDLQQRTEVEHQDAKANDPGAMAFHQQQQ